MATGIIGSMAASTTLRYTPTSDAKVSVTGTGSTISINGFSYGPSSPTTLATIVFFAGANQLITITTAATTTALVSSLESAS